MSRGSRTDEQAFRLAEKDLEDLAGLALGGAEGLDGASCAPNITYLAEVGIGAASRGCSRQGWREEASKTRELAEIDEAETCMRKAGLWPWA